MYRLHYYIILHKISEIIKLILARIFQLLTEILLKCLIYLHFRREGSAEKSSRRNDLAPNRPRRYGLRAERAAPNNPIPLENEIHVREQKFPTFISSFINKNFC